MDMSHSALLEKEISPICLSQHDVLADIVFFVCLFVFVCVCLSSLFVGVNGVGGVGGVNVGRF